MNESVVADVITNNRPAMATRDFYQPITAGQQYGKILQILDLNLLALYISL